MFSFQKPPSGGPERTGRDRQKEKAASPECRLWENVLFLTGEASPQTLRED